MPAQYAELPPSFSRSSEGGRLADTRTRSFRILLNSPAEVFNPQAFVGVRIGDAHPWDSTAYCVGLRCEFEGTSRMTVLAHFDYKQAAGKEDNKNQEPSVRPANWSIDAVATEMPTMRWVEINSTALAESTFETAVNPAGDMYDGLAHVVPAVTITIDQYEATDPTRHAAYCGYINEKALTVGSLVCPPHTVMLKGISTKPHVEAFGETFWRGWVATYAFSFRYNYQKWHTTGAITTTATREDNVGWDAVVPVTGFNIINTNVKGANVEDGALNLEHESVGADGDRVMLPMIKGWSDNTYALAAGTDGDKMRAMVTYSVPDNKVGQRPATQPVPLNMDGTPRKQSLAEKVILKRYRTQPRVDFAIFNLRLY